MSGPLLWFIGIVLLLPLMWWAGCRIGRVSDHTRRGVFIGAAMFLLVGWCWLIRHPSVAVQLVPLSALARLEGIGAAPVFAFVVGIAWSLGELRRQRAFVVVAVLLGGGYFVQGGSWMLKQTPATAFATGRSDYPMEVLQSQDYSCVPAACATALRVLGVETDEAEMARLTETRPGSGATLLRAMHGLTRRLEGEGLRPQLIEPTYEDLRSLPVPALTPVQYEPTRLHMITILRVRPDGVLVADPAVGIEFVKRSDFEAAYRGQVISFERTSQDTRRLDPQRPSTYWMSRLPQPNGF